MSEEATVLMPIGLTKDLIDAVRNDPLTAIDDKEKFHEHLGWLICAYDVMVRAAAEIGKTL